MTEWGIGILLFVNLPIACWLFYQWRGLKTDIQNRYPSKKVNGKLLIFWLVGIWSVGIWSLFFIDYSRSVSGPLVGFRLLMIWCGCAMAIYLWHRREMKRISGKRASETPSRDRRPDGSSRVGGHSTR